MKNVGMLIWLLGAVVFLFAAFGMETSVANDAEIFGGTRTINIGLQQSQMIAVLAGLTLFLSGSLIHALAILFEVEKNVSQSSTSSIFQEQIGAEIDPVDLDVNDDEEMQQLGVKMEGGEYFFASYRYSSLSDALRYARAHQSERN